MEIILPSGRFATIRPITFANFLESTRSGNMLISLICLTTTIDDCILTGNDVLNLGIDEIAPIIRVMDNRLNEASLNAKGVKKC